MSSASARPWARALVIEPAMERWDPSTRADGSVAGSRSRGPLPSTHDSDGPDWADRGGERGVGRHRALDRPDAGLGRRVGGAQRPSSRSP
ncbi:hypothetical protein [Leptolyngbya sp. 7M]|uniref:hypothetical protein n=1 Tax=Leptolyngbya sp. 7M TaxID=2812896 RepID=UPI001CEC5076|nr:hypothetical protein [Leptolyngbya sp. 7M]